MQRHLVCDLATACQACNSSLSHDLGTVRLQNSSMMVQVDALSCKPPAADAEASVVLVREMVAAMLAPLACSLLSLADPEAVSTGIANAGCRVPDSLLTWIHDPWPSLIALLLTSPPPPVLLVLLEALARSCCNRCSAEAVLCCGEGCTGLMAGLSVTRGFVAESADCAEGCCGSDAGRLLVSSAVYGSAAARCASTATASVQVLAPINTGHRVSGLRTMQQQLL